MIWLSIWLASNNVLFVLLIFRECQVSHWKKHKKACDLLMDSIAEIKQKAGKVET